MEVGESSRLIERTRSTFTLAAVVNTPILRRRETGRYLMEGQRYAVVYHVDRKLLARSKEEKEKRRRSDGFVPI